MLLTEEEAREKWCPFARVIDGSPGNADGVGACAAAVNRGVRSQDQQALRCIGSACMAWRWRDAVEERVEFYNMDMRPEGDGWQCELSDEGREIYQIKSRWRRTNPARRGYCGLAGKPE